MKRFKMIAVVAPLLVAVTAFAQSGGTPTMGVSAGRDLDALWTAARNAYDLDRADAVILLEARKVQVGDDGAVATRVHRVVWINSAVGIRSYADLRVPWDSADSGLDVEILRTWRDGRWWPDPVSISETAVVHTLPRALERADDYCAMRETMLLHDGVELPCILETAYTVTRHGPETADGLFCLPQRDPAVEVELVVDTPADLPFHHQEINGAPSPTAAVAGGRRTFVWRMSPVPSLQLPVTEQPEAYESTIAWSAWESWDALAAHFLDGFTAAARVEGALADSLTARTLRVPDQLSRVRAVLDFVDESTRKVAYDDHFWRQAPRPAGRTWETGYGHDLDRAVLAAGALRSLALRETDATEPLPGGRGQVDVNPIFVGGGNATVAPQVPRLAGIGGIALSIATQDGSFIWSPASGLHDGAWTLGRPTTTLDPLRPLFVASPPAGNRLALSLTLTRDKEEGWRCAGALAASGGLNVHDPVVSSAKTLDQVIGDAVAPLIEGLTIESCAPRSFRQDAVSLEFKGALPAPPAGDDGGVILLVGCPGGGVKDRLPGDVHLYEGSRESPVLASDAEQQITLQMHVGESEVLHLPAAVDISNAAGRFRVDCTAGDGWLTYLRSLTVSGKGTWPELRALLLEEADPLHGTIILKEKEAE